MKCIGSSQLLTKMAKISVKHIGITDYKNSKQIKVLILNENQKYYWISIGKGMVISVGRGE